MAQLSGFPEIFDIDTARYHDSALLTLGTRGVATNGTEWIYLRGTASVVAGNWVLIGSAFATSRAVADDQGALAIAGTAITLDRYGWFQIYGPNTVAGNSGAVAVNSALWLTANAGYVDDVDVAADAIVGAASLSLSAGSAFTVYLNYPFVHDIALD